MKRILFIVLVTILGSTLVHAQKASIVGKWKFASLDSKEMKIDLENPQNMRKLMAEQMKKGGAEMPDSAMDVVISTMLKTFEDMSMEFTADGKGIVSMSNPATGAVMGDTATYTVDYDKGVLHTYSKKEGKEKKEQINFKFEGEYLVMKKQDDEETVRLKRVK